MERFRMQFVKKVQFEKLYVLICLRPRSENVAIPHPPLRGTFPPGEGIGPPIYNFTISLLKPITCIGIWRTGAKRNRFPRGGAVERSETDEERRNIPTTNIVR